MKKLEGKVAVVTGAARGIGRAISLALAHEGARVLVSDVLGDEGQQLVEDLCRDTGADAHFVRADVSDAAQVEALVSQAVEIYGHLDLACNNAGIEGPTRNLVELEEADWHRVLGVNLTGVWLCMKYQIRQFLAQGSGGRVVNIASIMGQVAAPNIASYTASKHGVLGLTKTAALEFAQQGIRVNAICPGGVHTTIIDRAATLNPDIVAGLQAATPMGHLGQPGDIATTAVWLLSEDSAFVTGQAITVDGGYTCR